MIYDLVDYEFRRAVVSLTIAHWRPATFASCKIKELIDRLERLLSHTSELCAQQVAGVLLDGSREGEVIFRSHHDLVAREFFGNFELETSWFLLTVTAPLIIRKWPVPQGEHELRLGMYKEQHVDPWDLRLIHRSLCSMSAQIEEWHWATVEDPEHVIIVPRK